MVKGVDQFRAHFKGFSDQYVLTGRNQERYATVSASGDS